MINQGHTIHNPSDDQQRINLMFIVYIIMIFTE